MQKVNGFSIIAKRAYRKGGGEENVFVILAAIRRDFPGMEFEYVTAVYKDGDREWYWGHYYTEIQNATNDYLTR